MALPQISKIAFIGTGVMGFPMASHLLTAGFKVNVYNRTKAKALPLQEMGAVVCNSVKEAVLDADLVISMVGFVEDVQEIWLGDSGIIKNMKENAAGIDMTTSDPLLAKSIAQEGLKAGHKIGDAPVTGGDIGAKNGTLTILYGGDEELFEALKPVFSAMGKLYVRFGDSGCGQLTKAANQIAVAAGMMALCESLAFTKAVSLDTKLVLDTLSQGAAGSFAMNSYGPRILKGDYNPGFYIKHFIKDLKIALKTAEKFNLDLAGTALALKLYQSLADKGKGDLGTQALCMCYSSGS